MFHQAGFRPCLRCRPEIAPNLRGRLDSGSSVFVGVASRHENRALNAISIGAVDETGISELATQLGVSDRLSPPYDWDTLITVLAGRAMPGIEVVTSDSYRRTISIGQTHGAIEVRPVPNQNYLIANIQFPEVTALAQIVDSRAEQLNLS